MKFFTCLSFLACLLCGALACDPDSNNMPNCATNALNIPVRNFWDPTAYWMCKSNGDNAELIRCPDAHLFDSAKGECIMWNEWTWTKPCPESA
uniref:Putative secreted protein n=1 Tax=Haematobia irritans TaxID=7368 RepID=A0A1L8EC49_HAEIR